MKPPDMSQEIYGRLQDYIYEEYISIWWNTTHPMLGAKPKDVDPAKVKIILDLLDNDMFS